VRVSRRRVLQAMAFAALVAGGRAAAVPCTGDRFGVGLATPYAYSAGSAACGYGGDDDSPFVAAAGPADFAAMALCGAWVHVTGPLGSIDLRIVDECATCGAGDLAVHADVFGAIANPQDGRAHVTWSTVPDPDDSPYVQLSAGSNLYFLQVQPRHTRYPVAGVEYLAAGGYVAARHESGNQFTIDGSITSVPLTGSFTLRFTDVNGQQVVAAGIPLGPNHVHPLTQFPACAPLDAPATGLPRATALRPPSPNPFHGSTRVAFDLARDGDVRLRLYDAAGRRVRTLVEGSRSAGRHEVAWDGRDDAGRALAAGLYFCRLASGDTVDQVRLTLAD